MPGWVYLVKLAVVLLIIVYTACMFTNGTLGVFGLVVGMLAIVVIDFFHRGVEWNIEQEMHNDQIEEL